MKNPWEEISLSDYENHMCLDSVMQFQALSEMMRDQFNTFPVSRVMILGVAGGNGLEHIQKGQFEKVYGVDVNAAYLEAAAARYPELKGVLECLHLDLTKEWNRLPKAELVIADLLVEYIGYGCFQNVIEHAAPEYVSCVIQRNTGIDWVSDSPYLHVFDGLEQVHCRIEEEPLKKAMLEMGYRAERVYKHGLPNGKELVRLDFKREPAW